MIKKGDKLRILPQWQDVGDDEFEWEACEDEDGGKVLIRALIPFVRFTPTQVVHTYMVQPGLDTAHADG